MSLFFVCLFYLAHIHHSVRRCQKNTDTLNPHRPFVEDKGHPGTLTTDARGKKVKLIKPSLPLNFYVFVAKPETTISEPVIPCFMLRLYKLLPDKNGNVTEGVLN